MGSAGLFGRAFPEAGMKDEDRKKEAGATELYEGPCCERWGLSPLSPLSPLSLSRSLLESLSLGTGRQSFPLVPTDHDESEH